MRHTVIIAEKDGFSVVFLQFSVVFARFYSFFDGFSWFLMVFLSVGGLLLRGGDLC